MGLSAEAFEFPVDDMLDCGIVKGDLLPFFDVVHGISAARGFKPEIWIAGMVDVLENASGIDPVVIANADPGFPFSAFTRIGTGLFDFFPDESNDKLAFLDILASKEASTCNAALANLDLFHIFNLARVWVESQAMDR